MSSYGKEANITGNVSISSNLNVGTLRINSGTITDTSGVVDFGGDNVLTTGNVGIGNTNPSYKLHIIGTQYGVSNSAHYDMEIGNYDGTSYNTMVSLGTDQSAYGSGGISLWQNGSVESVRLSGNSANYFNGPNIKVGIGTTSPTTILDVRSTDSYTQGLFQNNNATNPGHIIIRNESYNEQIQIRSRYDGEDNHIFTWNGSAMANLRLNTSMMLLGNGNVGIGTTNPLTKLHIGNSANAFQLTIDGATAYPSAGFLIGGWTGNNHANKHTIQSSSNLHIDSADNGDIYMNNYSARGMYLCLGGGNVGIGKTNPQVKLDVVGAIRATSNIISYVDANNYVMFDYNGNIRRVHQGNSGSGFHLTISSIIPMDWNGSLGNGTINFGGPSNRWSVIYCNNIYNSAGIIGSDDRLKHNEEPVLNALSTINKLNVKLYDKTYDMLDADYMGDLTDHEHFREVGIIAQDVLKIPELKDFVKIPEDIETQPYGVNYNCIFSLGLKAIQELSVENLEQQTALEKQGKIIDDLLSRIEALENK